MFRSEKSSERNLDLAVATLLVIDGYAGPVVGAKRC